MKKDIKVGVLMGGLSQEAAISLQSGEAVVEALRARGYQAEPIIVDERIDQVLRESSVDVIFNALHGRFGEDGCIQGLLEMMRIPYTGSGVLASALSMDKIKAKEIFRLHNLPTPYYTFNSDELRSIAEVHGSFGYPVVVKPASEGSSIGVSLVESAEELEAACDQALELDRQVLVERHIAGQEVHVGIINGQVLGAIGIVPHNALFDYQAKYTPGYAHYHLPAKLSAERYRGVLTQALRAYHALGCRGAARVDMIVSELGNEYILEINTAPGLTKRSLLPRLAEYAKLGFEEMVERVLSTATLDLPRKQPAIVQGTTPDTPSKRRAAEG